MGLGELYKKGSKSPSGGRCTGIFCGGGGSNLELETPLQANKLFSQNSFGEMHSSTKSYSP